MKVPRQCLGRMNPGVIWWPIYGFRRWAGVGGDSLTGGRRTALLNTNGVSTWSQNVVLRSEVVGGHEKRLKEMTWNCWS
jgi:hypothetical protein